MKENEEIAERIREILEENEDAVGQLRERYEQIADVYGCFGEGNETEYGVLVSNAIPEIRKMGLQTYLEETGIATL